MNTKKRKKSLQKSKLIYEIYGVLLISIAVLSFISIYFNSAGILGYYTGLFIKGIFGFGGYIVPFFILMLGIGFIVKQDKINIKLKFYAICALFLFLILIIEVKRAYIAEELTILERITLAYEAGQEGIGGGAAGEIMAYPVVKLLGETGAYLFASTFVIINILIITNASIYKMMSTIKNRFKKIFLSVKTLIMNFNIKPAERSAELKAAVGAHSPEEALSVSLKGEDKKEYIDDINKKIKILDFFKSSETQDNNEGPGTMEESFLEEMKPAELKEVHRTGVKKEEKVHKLEKLDIKKEEKITEEISESAKQVPPVYKYPPISLLYNSSGAKNAGDKKELINNAKILEETLESFGVEAKVVQVSRGPVITRYELQPSPGVKVSKIVNLSDDIALNLAAQAVRIEAPIPGKAAVGIEIPNKEISVVYLKEIIESKEFTDNSSPLTFALGKDVAGNCVIADMAKMPHLLIAGATGSGKSVCVNALITSILYKSPPEKVRLLMVDPKMVELSTYNGVPHLLIPVVTDARKSASALNWAVQEMTNRYKLFADNNVRNIESYNSLISQKNPEGILPKIVIIIDELADLMMVAPNDVEDCICRLAQMARAAGMHLVVATQRPSVDVLTGVIKANIPSRISFAVSSQIDSRTILDMSGAEKLLGKGDMLYYPVGESKPQRVQGAFITEKEVEKVVSFVKEQYVLQYKEEIMDEIENTNSGSDDADDMLPEAIKIVVETGQASVSLLQRRLRVGYNRAARLIDSMEHRGIIGGYEGSKPRQVLISKEEYEELI
ncbi:DNA translocase SpoIIIE [Oxobacter pfennigii]|uniref:DNA translocase SpoIIIE n=1 Tax=Oxobacter pfennigii TaxID=36849 RepID=A0A0P9AEX6_9CLOT|nr:DNA translocase FtsK [Oxobacter pfennigii]KPU43891.1 DNA translocase SpoIIIE [Oxobacter pfennigii]